jgi:chromosome segregation ATPase
VVYMRAKDTAIEVARATALNAIKGGQIVDLQGQRDSLAATATAYQAQLTQREREVEDREAAMAQLNASKAEQETSISTLQAQVAEMQAQLVLARQEQERMKKIEDAYFATRRSEEAALHKRKQEASALLDAMTRDSARLRDELCEAQQQGETSEHMAQAEEDKERALLDAAVAEARRHEDALGQRRSALQAQETANISVESQVTGLKVVVHGAWCIPSMC